MQKTKHNGKPTNGAKTATKNKQNNSKISRKKPTGKAPNKTKQRPPNNGGNSLVASLKNGLKMAMSIGLPVLLIVVAVVQLSLYGYLPSHFYYSSQYIYSSAVGWLICSFIIGFIVKPKENKEEAKKVGKKAKSNARMEEEEEIEGAEEAELGDEYFGDGELDEDEEAEEEAPPKKSVSFFGSKEKKANKKAKKKVKPKKVIEEEIEEEYEDEEVLEDDMYAEELVMEQPKSRIAKPVPTLTSQPDDMGDLLDLYSSQGEPQSKVDLHAAKEEEPVPAPEMVKLVPVVEEVINEEPEPVIPEPPKVEEKVEEPRVITPPPAQHINLKGSSSKAVFQERIVETKPAEVPEVKEERPQPVEEVPVTAPTVVEQARQEYPEVPYVRPAIPTIATTGKILTRQEFAVDMVNKAYNELTAVEKFVLDYDILEAGQEHLILNEGSNLLRCTSVIINGRLYSASECHSINIPDKAQVVCFYGVRINKLNRKGNLKPMHKLEAIASDIQVPTLEFLVRTGSVLHVVAYFDEPRIVYFRDLTCSLNFSTEGERY